MDWTKGYKATWEVLRMNVDAWAPDGKLANVESFSVSRSCTDAVPLIETAAMEVDDEFEDGWYKLSMIAEQGSVERFDIGVFLFETTGRTHNYGRVTMSAEGYSVLKPADDVLMPYGQYAPRGTNGAEMAASLLRACTPAPIVVDETFTVDTNVVFSIGMSHLAAAWMLLDAGGFCIQIDGDGTIHIMRKPSTPDIELSRFNASMLMPSVTDDQSVTGVPNRYYAIAEGRIVTAINDSPASSVSYRNRGRWVDAVDTSPTPVNGETLEQYAARKLEEAATITKKLSYTREYYPSVRPFSVVRGSMADIGLDGDMMVLSQSLTCDKGITVQETAGQAVRL